MATEKRKKNVTYKHVLFAQSGPVLKALLDEALGNLSTVGERRQSLAPTGENPIWRVIASSRIETEMTFGVLLQYTPGTNPRLLIDDPAATELQVEQFTTPATEDGKRREPMEGTLYFAVFGNHLVFMQSLGLRSSHLEDHFAWLLHHAKVLEETNQGLLVDKPPPAIEKKLAANKVKKLEIGGQFVPTSVIGATQSAPSQYTAEELGMADAVPAVSLRTAPTAFQVAIPAPENQPSAVRASTKTIATTAQASNDGGGILAALKSLMNPDVASKLDFDALAGSNIEYTLEVTYKGHTTDKGQKLMDSLGTALRHADDVETKISLLGGGSISGQDIKISGPVILNFMNGEAARDDVFEALRTWLISKVQSGEVKD